MRIKYLGLVAEVGFEPQSHIDSTQVIESCRYATFAESAHPSYTYLTDEIRVSAVKVRCRADGRLCVRDVVDRRVMGDSNP